ncbi:MAG: GyrI-like domain-containing protein [Flavisolibacter sp.]
MTYTTIKLDSFSVVGLAVRTTNQSGQSQRDIGELWQRFFKEHIIEKILDKINDDIYCIYTDYESDMDGAYTAVLGCRVKSLQKIPEGLSGKLIPKASYRLYKSKGKMPGSLLATWKDIWQSSIQRQYLADFDVYRQKPDDTTEPEVETYVSVQ